MEDTFCSNFPAGTCSSSYDAINNMVSVKIQSLTVANMTGDRCRDKTVQLVTSSSDGGLCDSEDQTSVEQRVVFGDQELVCEGRTNIVPDCGDSVTRGRAVTNSIYFALRTLATMALACVFIILDAQTIQMCKMEEEAGNGGSYGRQIVYKTLAQAIISPLVGVIMDKITELTGHTNYVAPFLICDLMLLGAFIALFFISEDIGLPKSSDTMKGVKKIMTNPNIMVFLIMVLMCGTMYGFVETFLFVFLKV